MKLCYLHKTPWIFSALFPGLTWKVENSPNVYLTFDDGPQPEVTDFVLEELNKYSASGTFFCVGENIVRYPDIFARLLEQGHRCGNHTFHHLNGWKSSVNDYMHDVDLCEEQINQASDNKLFRPPYGKLCPGQIRTLKEQYQVVMWSLLPGDFDPRLTADEVLAQSIKHTRPGSVVVFHDSMKTFKKLQYVLPRYLEYLAERGIKCSVL